MEIMKTEILEQHWKAYIDAFNTTAEQDRWHLLEQSVAADLVFTNPGGEGNGRAALNAHIAKFQEDKPGMYFTTDKLYPQSDKLLAIWSMHTMDGAPVATGYNFVRTDQSGRFNYMAGFF
jgi:hypothetical protein